MKENWYKVYFDNGVMRAFHNVKKVFFETWLHIVYEKNGKLVEATINPDKILYHKSPLRRHLED